MVSKEQHDCPRCKGHGVYKVKGSTVEIVCGCTAGRMLASWVPTRIEMWSRHG